MALKQWLGRLQPVPLYVMLGLTAALFVVQLVLSHITHALTLLVDSYHMLCNLIALSGCIITIKKGLGGGSGGPGSPGRSGPGSEKGSFTVEDNSGADTEQSTLQRPTRSAADRRLRNTFGWARIDVLVSLIGCVFLASLSFSLLVEAVQTLLHIDHHDEMHEPLYVAGAGAASLLVNALCYVLIGGYTFHQGSFFHVTPSGDVVLERAVTQDSVKLGERRLSAQRRPAPRSPPQFRQRQGFREMLRDTVGCVVVIITALTVFFTDKSIAKYADPIMSIGSAILLLALSYPYMKEAGLILLQTIPEHIDIDQLCKDFYLAFPDIVNVHDLHVWRLTQARIFCTAHVVFRNPQDYQRINKDVTAFFDEQGVTQVTVQPEFLRGGGEKSASSGNCLMTCPGESCLRAHCCGLEMENKEKDDPHYIRVASDISLPRPPGEGNVRQKHCHLEHVHIDHNEATHNVVVEMNAVSPSTSPIKLSRETKTPENEQKDDDENTVRNEVRGEIVPENEKESDQILTKTQGSVESLDQKPASEVCSNKDSVVVPEITESVKSPEKQDV